MSKSVQELLEEYRRILPEYEAEVTAVNSAVQMLQDHYKHAERLSEALRILRVNMRNAWAEEHIPATSNLIHSCNVTPYRFGPT